MWRLFIAPKCLLPIDKHKQPLSVISENFSAGCNGSELISTFNKTLEDMKKVMSDSPSNCPDEVDREYSINKSPTVPDSYRQYIIIKLLS